MLLTIFVASLGSSGLWAWLTQRTINVKETHRLLLGIAHDLIITKGSRYIKRGWITIDEYEDLVERLWIPYSRYDSNGSAKRIIENVKTLEIKHRE